MRLNFFRQFEISMCSCGAQWWSIASAAQKVVGSIPREHILMKMYNLNAL